jgi:hypothetical protein
MSALPPANTAKGTLHVLKSREGRESVYEWTGEAWSKPGTGWGTKWPFMQALGWSYLEPEADRLQRSAEQKGEA